MCRSTVDIHSATAEIRRGKKERKKKPQGKNIMSASAIQGGHKNESKHCEMGPVRQNLHVSPHSVPHKYNNKPIYQRKTPCNINNSNI